MRTTLLGLSLVAAITAGCTGSGSVRYSAEVTTPPLVYVSDDVQVIEDYDQPVFYSANMYWRYDNGVWFSSRYHTRGWVRVETVPVSIRRIDRPTAYVHYRASAHTPVVRDHRDPMPAPEPVVRDHRDAPPPPPPTPAPVVRDHRDEKEEKREEKREIKEEKREIKEEKRDVKEAEKRAKDERKEDKKQEKKEERDEKKAKRGK
jgi:hypothetical protein